MLDPEILVLDEPVSALDVSIQAQIINLLKRLQTRLELSYLFIAHDLNVVGYISDWVAVMYLGQIMEYAPAEKLFDKPLHPYTQALYDSIPRLTDTGKRRLEVIHGVVPNPLNFPSGCRFHPRCPHCMKICPQEEPELKNLGDEHWVACHLH